MTSIGNSRFYAEISYFLQKIMQMRRYSGFHSQFECNEIFNELISVVKVSDYNEDKKILRQL